MKRSWIVLLLVISIGCFANSTQTIRETMSSTEDNILVKQYSNLQTLEMNHASFNRYSDYPTQVVRLKGDLNNSGRHCEEILQEIDNFFAKKITPDKFIFNTMTLCAYEPNTHYAKYFAIESHFDPLNEAAIDYLKSYLAEYNGRNLLGVIFEVENARGVVVSLNINSGRKLDRNDHTLLRLRQDNQSHYFANDYDFVKTLVLDARQAFFSTDPDIILPFIAKWFFPGAEKVYSSVLKRSNYVELQPEKIFMMEKAPLIFSPRIKLYFIHQCIKENKKFCL